MLRGQKSRFLVIPCYSSELFPSSPVVSETQRYGLQLCLCKNRINPMYFFQIKGIFSTPQEKLSLCY